MTVKEIRKNAFNKYRSHKLNSWAIGIVCGLFCAAVVALNLLWPFFSLFTVPLLVLPFFFACSVMNAAFEEGADLSVNLFFKSFILFFKTPFNRSFNLVKSFLKSVIVFIATMFLSSMVVYTIFQGLYGDTFTTLLEKFTNLAYSLNSNYEDMINVLYEEGCILMNYFIFTFEPGLYLSVFVFVFLVSKESLSIYLSVHMPKANPSYIHATYKRCTHNNFGDFYKKYFALNWPFFLLMLLGVIGGIILVPFDDLDPIKSITFGVMFGFTASSFFIPFLLCNNQALYEAYEIEFRKASEEVAKDIIRRMEIFSDFTAEEVEKMHESMTKTFNPLNEEDKTENKDDSDDNDTDD